MHAQGYTYAQYRGWCFGFGDCRNDALKSPLGRSFRTSAQQFRSPLPLIRSSGGENSKDDDGGGSGF